MRAASLSRAAGLGLAAGLVLSCGGRSGPVGGVAFAPGQVRLAYPESAAATLSWTPARPLDRRHGEVFVFVHLLEQVGGRPRVVRTFDHRLPSAWTPGAPQSYEIDLYQSALSDPIPPGRYGLAIGLYDESWGYRWPLETPAPEAERREYRVAEVEVTGPSPAAPRFSFSGAWKPLETVDSKQVRTRRCLAGPAAIAVDDVRSAGSVRMQWSVLGKAGSAVGLETTCETGRRETIGPGRPWLGVGVQERCEIKFEPTVTSDSGPPSCLEVLTWRPAREAARP